MEHHVGFRAIKGVLPDVPLSFALSASHTLTQHPATHVRTVQYGLRRIYREASQWWHRCEGLKPVLKENSRPFPLPIGMLREKCNYKVALAGDMADDRWRSIRAFRKQLRLLQDQYLKSEIVLLHLPQFNRWHGAPIADEVFELAQANGLAFAHPGVNVGAATIRLLANIEYENSPTKTASFPELKNIEFAKQKTKDRIWYDYFLNGGFP